MTDLSFVFTALRREKNKRERPGEFMAFGDPVVIVVVLKVIGRPTKVNGICYFRASGLQTTGCGQTVMVREHEIYKT